MTNEEKAILKKCGIHYENDTLEKEIAVRVITETRKQFKEYLKKRKKQAEKATEIFTDELYIRIHQSKINLINEILIEFFKEV